ncbi:MAG TPA: glycosyltransferase family 39 protein [Thermoanaerobaculia bacterium]|nr:glycosyltransferase family 39 protein [Thermoanaerobaculia bacterium]
MKRVAGRAGGWTLVLLTAAFFFRGVFFALALPAGDPLDETFHFAYACFLAQTARVPGASEPSIPLEFGRATAALPATGLPGTPAWSDYARISPEERSALRAAAYEFRPAERSAFFAPNYETQQPPLFYGVAAPLLRLLPAARFSTRLAAVRLLAVLLAAAAVPLAYRFLRRVLPKRAALAATAAWVAFPGAGIFVGRFTNDAMALPLAAALLGLFAEAGRGRLSRGRTIALAALLAAALWTKLYFLLFVPPAILAAILARRRGPVRAAVLAPIAAALLILPWALHQRSETGDWLGINASRQATVLSIGLTERFAAFPDFLTPRFAVVFARTFLWPGTRSASGAPAAAAVALAIALLALAFGPLFSPTARSRLRMRSWWIAGLAAAIFVAGQLSYASTYAAIGRARGHAPVAGPDGWYLLLLFPVILTAGCALGRAARPRSFLLAAAVFLAAEALMTFGVLTGVYSGRTSFNGANVPFPVYAAQLLRLPENLASYERVGLGGLPAAALGILAAAWVVLLGAGIISISRRRRGGGTHAGHERPGRPQEMALDGRARLAERDRGDPDRLSLLKLLPDLRRGDSYRLRGALDERGPRFLLPRSASAGPCRGGRSPHP